MFSNCKRDRAWETPLVVSPDKVVLVHDQLCLVLATLQSAKKLMASGD